MSDGQSPGGWFAVLLRPGAHAQAHIVRADRAAERGNRLVLLRDDRVVHTFEPRVVAECRPCANRRDAETACREWRETIGRSGTSALSVDEAGAPAPRGRRRVGGAVPLEGVSLRINE